MIKVLFVCLGNICRSPMAQGIFEKLVLEAELNDKITCDSAGIIGYHSGELPDSRMRQTAKKNQITLTHRSRQINPSDFHDFNYIIGMDANNMKGIHQLARHQKNTNLGVFKMRAFDNQKSDSDVEDPYYQENIGFDICYKILLESCTNFLSYLIEQHQLKKG